MSDLTPHATTTATTSTQHGTRTAREMTMADCHHDLSEQETACAADGLCPLCLQRENAELREALEVVRREANLDEWPVAAEAIATALRHADGTGDDGGK